MVKICLISDSHGNRLKVENLLLNNKFDYVFFMGDGLKDFENIEEIINLKKVSGNCDFFSFEAITQFTNVEGFKIMQTHGHEFRAKLTPLLMLEKAKNNYCDIVCFGHTHKQSAERIEGILFINPGAFKNGEYAVLTLQKNEEPKVELLKLEK
ncbi:MAG: YfcE family phosphodiesterase [Clostridia bacterium]|nr:YfcE family phosphodiesterase [Clostridia bacterium]